VSRAAGEARTQSFSDAPAPITDLLRQWGQGDPHAEEALLASVYQELRRQAAVLLRRERRGHTLQPTALVHEAYLRLTGQDRTTWRNRVHFYAVAARMMRRILVDYARARQAAKRPNPERSVPLHDAVHSVNPPDVDLLALDGALSELGALDARQGHIIELCYFGGLSEQEVADLLSISRSTVAREWRSARAWLYQRMTRAATDVRNGDPRALGAR
jgi:RNA polymerase sigma factor (TIGR02999 family)